MTDRSEESARRGAPGGSEEPTHKASDGPSAVPRRIGRYRIRRLIGAGGMGAVYEALQDQPHRVVALKVMRRGATSPSAARRFDHEVQLLGRLSHPAIAQIYEAGTYDDGVEQVPYFAMEYIAGARPITTYADERGLDLRERLALFATVCDAVHHGHKAGVIHRDLKPANILVGAAGHPKIIDFGVARATDSDLALTTMQTGVGHLVGTLQYMSPEQCAADPHGLDPRSDVYALGVVLYQLLTGRLPFDLTDTPFPEAIRVIQERPAPAPSTHRRAIRGDLETIVLKAMEKDRERRYPSAEALAQDIRRYLAGEPIIARRPTYGYILRRRGRALARRHPVVALICVAIIAALLAHFVARPIVYNLWPAPAGWFQRLVTVAVPDDASAPRLDNVRLIAMTDATDFAALAAAEGLEGVDPAANPRSLRRLHGRLMEKLAASGARVVAWDVFFPVQTEFDDDFARGVAALHEARITPIVAIRTWQTDRQGAPALSPVIASAPGIRWGGIVLETGPGTRLMQLAHQRGAGETRPGLALLAAAAYQERGAELVVRLDRLENTIQINYREPHPTIPGVYKPAAAPQAIKPTSMQIATQSNPWFGVHRGDYTALYMPIVPSEAALEAISYEYADVMRASDAQLRAWFADAAVVIGDLRTTTPSPDWHTHPDGRHLPGCYEIVAAIQGLIARLRPRLPGVYESIAFTITASVLGTLAVAATPRQLIRRAVAVLALGLGAVGLSVAAFGSWQYLCNPTVPLIALVLAAAIGSTLDLPPRRDAAA